MRALRKGSFLLVILSIFAWGWTGLPGNSASPRFAFPTVRFHNTDAPVYETRFASHGLTKSVHSASLVEVPSGELRAFWYGGSREGAGDVALFTSVFDPEASAWREEIPLVSREGTQKRVRRYVKKLGNPVALVDGDHRLWLFYVSVSVGGWSGSAINALVSDDEGRTWSGPRRLIASPFLNLSTAVKGPPVLLEDGSIALPAYHELLGRFGELLFLDRTGSVVRLSRLTWGASSLQPVVVPMSSLDALAFLRYAGASPRRVLWQRSSDGGLRWTPPEKTELANPNAAISCIRPDDGLLLMVLNDSEEGRNVLSLAASLDGGETWRVLHRFEEEAKPLDGPPQEYSYPCLIQASRGDFHVLYTWRRTRIKHVRFNRSWLDQRLD